MVAPAGRGHRNLPVARRGVVCALTLEGQAASYGVTRTSLGQLRKRFVLFKTDLRSTNRTAAKMPKVTK